jgi:hypothetical protein
MKPTVEARLSVSEQRVLADLVRRLGWSASRIVREGLRLVAASHAEPGRKRIAGLGQFCSGIPDLGSSKRGRKGFGR